MRTHAAPVTNVFQRHWEWQEDRVRGSVRFEISETEKYSRCIRHGGVQAPLLGGQVAKYVLWKEETAKD